MRKKWGDRPDHDEYLRRFTSEMPDLLPMLRAVDEELGGGRDVTDSSAFVPPRDHAGARPAATLQATRLKKLQSGQEIDDFRLLHELGAGTFARVFLAQQKSMQRFVALKISKQRSDEPPVLSNLNHPNIVRVFDERQAGHLHLLYMQYVRGGNLKEVIERLQQTGSENASGRLLVETTLASLRKRGEVPIEPQRNDVVEQMMWGATVCWIGARLADALHFAHQQGIWHRDIKPANILLTADARPMLADFNVSFAESLESHDPQDSFGGTLAYMSPEQLEVCLGERSAEEVQADADVYSLAIVLWELLTGRHPFGDKTHPAGQVATIREMLRARRNGPPLDQLPPDCPGGLREVFVSCMAPTAATRCVDAGKMTRELALATSPDVDQLITPPAGSWSSRVAKRPVRWLILCGLVPNGTMALLNIWANFQLTTRNFDREFFREVQMPAINAVVFPLGMILCIGIIAPMVRMLSARRRRVDLKASDQETICDRCLSVGGRAALLIFSLWVATGLAFPLWNSIMPASRVDAADVSGFLSSQVLHGLIASSLTFVFVTLVTLEAFYPHCLLKRESEASMQRLDWLDRALSWTSDCLGLTPLLALLALSLTDRVDKAVYVALALVGCAGHLVTRLLAPRIRSRIQSLKRSLLPTEELLRGDPR